jgi:hypothetical protein
MHWRQQKEEARRRPKEMEAALAVAALSFLFLSPPSSSVLRTPVVAAAEGASRFSRRLQRAVITRTSLWCSAGLGLLYTLACAQAVKPPVPTPGHQACICDNNARRAVVVGGMWHAGCGLCEVVRLFYLDFDVAPLSLRLAKTDSSHRRGTEANGTIEPEPVMDLERAIDPQAHPGWVVGSAHVRGRSFFF